MSMTCRVRRRARRLELLRMLVVGVLVTAACVLWQRYGGGIA